MLDSHKVQTWISRFILTSLFLGMVLLNIKVLSGMVQSDSGDINDLNQNLMKNNGKRTLKQPAFAKAHSSTLSPNADNPTKVIQSQALVRLQPPIHQPRNCKQAHCEEYLQKYELIAMQECSAETSKRTVNGKIQSRRKLHMKENDCSFVDGTHRLPVALASTSGSGNTWIRGLLEKATGICTGFLYCDFAMRREGFIGENIKSGSVLVVKTHTIAPKWYRSKQPQMAVNDPYYGSAIYILRNPYKSMIAEWNRRVTYDILRLPNNESHTNVVQEKFWRIPEWDEFLQSYMGRWKARLENWVLNSHNQAVHVVRYEMLQQDVIGEVSKMLSFLKIPFIKEELPTRLHGDFTKFKRKHINDKFEHYSSSQTEFIQRMLMDTIKLAQLANKSHVLQIEDYLPVI